MGKIKSIDDLPLELADTIILRIHVMSLIGRYGITLTQFANSLEPEEVGDELVELTPMEIDKILNGKMTLTKQRFQIIIAGIYKWDKGGRIFHQLYKELFGLTIGEQLDLFSERGR